MTLSNRCNLWYHVLVDKIDIISMFLLGLFGTGHCIGMCGPLVLAIPGASGRFAPNLAYHLGRVFTYTLVGGIAGAIGSGLVGAGASGQEALLEVNRFRIALSLLTALFLLLFGLVRLRALPEPRWMSAVSPAKFPGISALSETASKRGGFVTSLAFGLLMGMLPCGLSYAAFARALPTASPWTGSLFVLAFGLGTVPGLLLMGTVASGLARKYRRHSDTISGLIMIVMAGSLAIKTLTAL